ncbi:MAG: right-handed parallel beta-helix repeat-containing protein [Candidatus Electrothrix sp. AS4_5]|nr:right-handed parallel beta-helix repeat-containing protein [Candidatus Electrothrix gigas]
MSLHPNCTEDMGFYKKEQRKITRLGLLLTSKKRYVFMITSRYFIQTAVFFLILGLFSTAWGAVWGDINGDGKIGPEEAVYALQVAAGTKPQRIDTTHSGTIVADETWTPAGNPHIITGTLTIAADPPNGATLVIQPGVEVRFEQGASIEVGANNAPGTLIAEGTASSGILFTSNQATKTKGWWKYIRFNQQAVNCRMSFCTVEYGGIYNTSYKYGGNLVIDIAEDAPVSLNNCTIQSSFSHGVCFLGSGLVHFSDNTITGNDYYGIRMYADQVRGIENSNKLAGNTLGGVYVITSTVKNDALWHKLDTPYILRNITVASQSAEPAVLTIEAGTELRFAEEGGIVIGDTDQPGKLVAQGQADKLIIFTSNQTEKTKGWWNHLRFTETDAGSILAHCTVEYGGRLNTSYKYAGNVMIYGAGNVSISNCTISNSGTNGVYFHNDQGFVNFSENTLTNNGQDSDRTYGGYGIKIYADQVRGIQSNNSVSGNMIGGVYVRSDIIENDATWHPLDAPYTVGTVTVEGVQPTLSIETGTELRFVEDSKLVVEKGRLVAKGTTFTSNQTFPTKGYWYGIQFGQEAVASSLTNCTVEYAGGSHPYLNDTNIDVKTANGLNIHNCTIGNSKVYGIKIWSGGKADLTGTSFTANETADIYVDMNSCANYTGAPVGSPVVVNNGTCD